MPFFIYDLKNDFSSRLFILANSFRERGKIMIKKTVLAAFCFSLFLAPAYQAAQYQEKHLDVPYVPTKYPVVDEMLRISGITKDDLLYDLGCGDGRIVIGAAQKYGARGIGIDIDPDRIAESKANAAKAKVEDKVQFIQQDLFLADFHQASVMTLYLLTSVNLKLRPKLLRELSPGTRLVSHNFGMDTWKPDQSTVVMVDDVSHDVYLWIVPSNVTGSWKWTMPSGKAAVNCEMVLEQHFQWPAGTVAFNGVSATVKEMALKGSQFRITLERAVDGKLVPMTLEGKVSGHNITGTIKAKVGGKDEPWEWKATRNPTTEKPLDVEPGKGSLFIN